MKITQKRLASGAALCALCFLLISCGTFGRKKNSLKIVNWNAQTFFDANKDGIEYSNFLKSKKWDEDAYKARLQKLCKAINELDGDLVVLEEIENQGIIFDISNALAGNSWNPAKVYKYSCFAKKENSSIGCAVLSRLPLDGMKVHSLDIQSERKSPPSMRPLIEVDLMAPKRLKIFVNHWKSKSGGGESALWRRWQESLLARKILEAQKQNPGAAIVCAGDFNQDISEFAAAPKAADSYGLQDSPLPDQDAAIFSQESGNHWRDQKAVRAPNVELRADFCGQKVLVYSPWLDYDGGLGSYNFRDKWEKIDHFFCCGNLALTDFSPQTGEWAYDDGRPKPFKIYSLNGWSDHLPIVCRVEF